MSSQFYQIHKEVLTQFDEIEKKFLTFSKTLKSAQKLNIKSILTKDYEYIRNELMNFCVQMIQNSSNISVIVHTDIDERTFNCLMERVQIIIKHPIDLKQMGKNGQIIISNIYSTCLEDLKYSFLFYKTIYKNVSSLEIPNELQKDLFHDMPIFIGNLLLFMGEIKRFKLMLNKKFNKFNEYINLEGDVEKDSKDAIKFYYFSLNNNPELYKVYKSLAYIYKEFLEKHTKSVFYQIKYLAYLADLNEKNEKAAELNKAKESLEKEFEEIRVIYNKKQYNIRENIDDTTFLKYDIEYLPILFYRILGILYWKIDTDKLENFDEGIKIITARYLRNFNTVIEFYKKGHDIHEINEINEDWLKMLMASIFILHYCVDNHGEKSDSENNETITRNILEHYPNKVEKINIKNDKPLLKFSIYNHNFSKKIQNSQGKIQPIIKEALNLLINLTKNIITNNNNENCILVERYLIILFYWLSLNYDLFNLIIDDEEKNCLRCYNYYLKKLPDIAKYLMPQTKLTLDLILSKINDYTMPIETYFIGFLPMSRFFQLNPKTKGLYSLQENKENPITNKLILIHFLDSFGLSSNSPANFNEFYTKFFYSNNNNNPNLQVVNAKPQDIKKLDEKSEKIKNQLGDKNGNRENEEITKEISGIFDSVNTNKINNKNVMKISTMDKPLIVLDASNIAMRHGNEKYSTKGIQIAIEFFTKNGHKVISFLPDYLFKEKDSNSKLAKKRVLPDNLAYLYGLVDKGLAVQTPPQDYDDSYCIRYAKKHDAFIVTNDLFRDYLDNFNEGPKRETEKMWIKEKCISYTFNKDEFLPNPDASFFRVFNLEEYNKNIAKN